MLVKAKKGVAVVLALLMLVTMLPVMNLSQTYAADATIDSVRSAIQALSADPSSFTAEDKDRVEAIEADFQSLSAEDQATLDGESSHPKTGQPLGRVLESALWAVQSYDEIDNSTTLPDGTYDASSDPVLSSTYSKGKSTSSRQRPWSVKSVSVKGGKAYATIAVESDGYSGIWMGGTTYQKTNTSGNCEFANVPIDLNSTFYFAGISTSMPTPIAFSLTTTITEPEPASETETFGFTLQVGQYTEGADFHTASLEGVTYALKDAEGNVYEPSYTTSGMLTYSKLDAEKTYTFTASKEGWAVVKQGEWSVDAHAYEYIWTGADSINVTITKEYAEKNISEYTHPGMIFRKVPTDFSAVDKLLEKVPQDLSIFTEDSAKALQDAVAAVDRTATTKEAVDAMTAALEKGLQGLLPKDGTYEVSITKKNGTPYYLYEGLADNDKENGKAVLVVKEGKMSAELVLKNASYAQVALGTKDEVMDAATAAGAFPEGTINIDLHDGEELVVNEKKYTKYSKVTVPVAALEKQIDYAYHSSNASKYTYNTGWYDHGAIYQAASLKALDTPEEPDSKIDLTITNNTGMFKAVTAYLEKSSEGTTLVMALSGSGYKKLFKGTYEAAVAEGAGIADKWVEGTTNADGKLEFRIPIAEGETYVPCVAISESYYNKFVNGQNPLERAFYPRQFEINEKEKTLVTGDYDETADFAVTSNVADFKVAEKASTRVVGGPNSNNYNVAPTLVMNDTIYDKVTYPTVVSGKVSEASTDLKDGKFAISLLNAPNKEAFKDKTPIEMKFHVAEDAPYAEAGTDVVRNVTIDKMAKLITIEGEALTEKTAALADGTYKATKITTDVTTEASGMIMVTAATVVIKDGKAQAVVTMKGTGADRFYVSETATKDTIIAEAIAEEQKEVGGEFGKLLGGLKLEGSSAYSFWPVDITLGQPTVYAARSASHFSKQDKKPEEYYYVHDFQIDAKDLEYVSESTELPITDEQEAQRYLNQFFLDGKVTTAATAASITGKNANVTVPYYDKNDEKIGSFIFKMAESGKFRSGWFVDSSILNSQHFSSSNLKKIRYPEGSNGTVTFNPKAAYRDEGMTFTATLKLFPADANYNQYDAEGVYYDKSALAEQEFTITLAPKPEERHVTIKVVDSVSGEEISGAVVTVTKDSDSSKVEPAEGVYTMPVPGSYTVKASAEGYQVPGTEDKELVEAAYIPKKDGETLTLKLIKTEDSKKTITFSVKDQMGDAVEAPVISVYPWADKTNIVKPEENGSYKLYTGTRYGYTITKEGYEDKTATLTPSEDATEEVEVNKYLSEQKFTFKVYDNKTNETLEGVTLKVVYGPSDADVSTYKEAQSDENGVYTIPIDNRVVAYGSKTGYEAGELGVWSLGFDPQKDCSFGLKALPDADYSKVNAAKQQAAMLDRSKYTEESLKALDDAIKAIDETKKIDEQAEVDAMAEAISKALRGLEKVPVEEPFQFDDVKDPTQWFYKDVYEIYETKNANGTRIMSGYENTKLFGPLDPVVRGQFAVMLHRLANEPEAAFDANIYGDVKNEKDFYVTAVMWAKEAKVITGYENGNFGPNDPLTREQLATILYRYAVSEKIDVSEAFAKGDMSQFTDADAVSVYAKDAVKWANGAGIVTGKEGENGTHYMDPNGTASRAEVAAMFMRYIKYIGGAN